MSVTAKVYERDGCCYAVVFNNANIKLMIYKFNYTSLKQVLDTHKEKTINDYFKNFLFSFLFEI